MVVPEDRARIHNHRGATGEDPFQEEAEGQLLLPGGWERDVRLSVRFNTGLERINLRVFTRPKDLKYCEGDPTQVSGL